MILWTLSFAGQYFLGCGCHLQYPHVAAISIINPYWPFQRKSSQIFIYTSESIECVQLLTELKNFVSVACSLLISLHIRVQVSDSYNRTRPMPLFSLICIIFLLFKISKSLAFFAPDIQRPTIFLLWSTQVFYYALPTHLAWGKIETGMLFYNNPL